MSEGFLEKTEQNEQGDNQFETHESVGEQFERYKSDLNEAQVYMQGYIEEALQRVPGLVQVDMDSYANPLKYTSDLMSGNLNVEPTEVLQADGSLHPFEPVEGVGDATLGAYQILLGCKNNLAYANDAVQSPGYDEGGMKVVMEYGREHIIGKPIHDAISKFEQSLNN